MKEPELSAFLKVLDPEENQTGGGAASAVAGAMAASLVGMVARVSIGKKNMPYPDDEYVSINLKTQELTLALLDGSMADSMAFDQVMIAYRMPKETDSDKEKRAMVIQKATVGATRTPINNGKLIMEVLELANKLKGKSNKNAASDLDCAFYLAKAGLRGVLSNVEINLTSIKDQKIQETLRAEAKILAQYS